jgi:hypothetical protein
LQSLRPGTIHNKRAIGGQRRKTGERGTLTLRRKKRSQIPQGTHQNRPKVLRLSNRSQPSSRERMGRPAVIHWCLLTNPSSFAGSDVRWRRLFDRGRGGSVAPCSGEPRRRSHHRRLRGSDAGSCQGACTVPGRYLLNKKDTATIYYYIFYLA